MSGIGLLAADAAPSLQSAFTTALGNIQTDVFSYIALAVPVGLAIVGAIFGIKKAVGFFKSLANK